MKELILGDNFNESLFILTSKMNYLKKDNFLFLGTSNLIDLKKSDSFMISTIYDKRNFDLFSGLSNEEIVLILSKVISKGSDIDYSIHKLLTIVTSAISYLEITNLSFFDFKKFFSYLSLENLFTKLSETNAPKELLSDFKYFLSVDQDFYAEKIDLIYMTLHSLDLLNIGSIFIENKDNPLFFKNKVYIHTKSNLLKLIVLSISRIKKIDTTYIIQNFSLFNSDIWYDELIFISKNYSFVFTEEEPFNIPSKYLNFLEMISDEVISV